MNYFRYLMLLCLLPPLWLHAQTGSSCGNPHVIPLDGVVRTFSTSSNTGGAVVCNNGNYPNTSPVTWFSITTNSLGEMPLLDITAADSSSCEIAMYTACSGGSILQTSSSMCFDDGWGLWSPAHNYTLLPNTNYRLRIKTSSATQLKIAGQSYTPTNGTCSGAIPLDSTRLRDHNACHRPTNEVTPGQLCAYTLENTAFYQFYIATTGSAIINISNITCDNGSANNGNGFQIGFFTGTCGALSPLSCTAGSGNFVQATTPVLAAGTRVYVAIDGEAGSNCQYYLQAINALKVLSNQEFKNFYAWKASGSNILKWKGKSAINVRYVIERSLNGIDFSSIGAVNSRAGFEELNYQFEDPSPLRTGYYRVRRIDNNGSIALSNTIKVERNDLKQSVKVVLAAKNTLKFEVESGSSGTMEYSVISISGQTYASVNRQMVKGINTVDHDISNLPQGLYVIHVNTGSASLRSTFFKAN